MIKALAIYGLLRLLLVAGLVAACWAVGLDGFLGIAIALGISIPASYLLLRRQRDALTAALVVRAERRTALRSRMSGSAGA
ncbi:MAG: DUF4229 domain-containing protein [Geodermatophilaceae bacterium]|nr:DUF4229 domain-containing protein [Geodermatophilaceae bacterium]